jgi:transcriptional regulatory protein LevR
MDLMERLQVLKTAGQIDEANYQLMGKIINSLGDKWEISLDEEAAAMLITHLAIALERVRKNGEIVPLDNALCEEVKRSVFADRGQQMIHEWEELLGRGFPEEEKGYLMLHACTLLERMANK